MTSGKARADHFECMSAAISGKTPTGSRLARTVIATSNGPCLRVSQGSVPVSAKLTLAWLPASRAALAKIIEPNVAGGRNTTWPSRKCGASVGDVGLREGWRRAQDQFGAGTASAMSVVTSQVHIVLATHSFKDARARGAMLRDLCRVAPPQADLVALQRKIPRGGK